MKIVLSTKDPGLRASPRYGGKGVFFEFFITNPPRGHPIGAAVIIVTG